MSLSDEEFRAKLEKHFSLYRINLRSPILASITYDQWYRVDILLVNELGLFRRKDIEPNGLVEIDCRLYSYSNDEALSHYVDCDVAVRPTRAFVQGELKEKSSVAGFEQSGKGAFEYCIKSSLTAAASVTSTDQKLYLYIYAKKSINFTTTSNILPLMIGPINLISGNDATDSSNTSLSTTLNPPYDTTLPLELIPDLTQEQMVYDGYRLFSPTTTEHVVIHEMWDTGIPGKIWDSALVMLDVIKSMIEHHPEYVENKHIIDLSAGTGLLGLYLASSNAQPRKVTITELDEAVHLINKNIAANPPKRNQQQLVEAKTLLWGNGEEAEACGKADLILASDVLYEAQFFKDLVKAFADLSHEKTRIYIGYKRRGLTEMEEEEFWALCNDQHFTVELLNYKDESSDSSEPTLIRDPDDILVPKITCETGVRLYRLIKGQ